MTLIADITAECSDLMLNRAQEAAIETACSRIAPTWPLDQFIAVNPYWGFVDQPMASASVRLRQLSGTSLLMSRSYYAQQWRAGAFETKHLQWAIENSLSAETTHRAGVSVEALIAALEQPTPETRRIPLITDAVDDRRDLSHAIAWNDVVTQHISQHCAAYFDEHQATWAPHRSAGLYTSWLKHAEIDVGPGLLTGFKGWNAKVRTLPRSPRALIALVYRELDISDEAGPDYFSALLLSMNGWASWCAYERWQAQLAKRPTPNEGGLLDLLAIRLAWEWILYHPNLAWKACAFGSISAGPSNKPSPLDDVHDWLLQAAMERAYQESLFQGLTQQTSAPSHHAESNTKVQAVFCIDVRSEVFRRALEASSPQVQTLGFAGFFGLPIAYSPAGTAMTRPQLPGLLAPALCATQACDEPSLGQALLKRRQQWLQWNQLWQDFKANPSSGFSFVETCGWLSGVGLIQKTLNRKDNRVPVEQRGLPTEQQGRLRPRLPLGSGIERGKTVQAYSEMVAGILGAMGLTRGFARLVLLAGHGSQSANNPHAAGLDCGACGGQTGEVNARVLAALLNDADIRKALAGRGINIPDGTLFVAGLHNTTTDALALFDLDLVPPDHLNDVHALQAILVAAGQRARAERAPSLGMEHKDTPATQRQFIARANDWAQVRPEWGLANNASFIVAPRLRSQHINLQGRTFLHDYDWRSDSQGKVLELIMTAPMVVTHWINMQYHASTVDNRRYGSGNKVLHNVVGGRLGVFEGNGGDLRIGLPWQSLHDGTRLRHTPLRLSVFIEAPQTMLNAVIEKHLRVRQLLDGQWLALFQLEAASAVTRISRYQQGQWVAETGA